MVRTDVNNIHKKNGKKYVDNIFMAIFKRAFLCQRDSGGTKKLNKWTPKG